MRGTVLLVAAVALLVNASADAVVLPPVPVSPLDYRVGPIPAEYQPFNYTAYPYTPGVTGDITDSSLATFTRLEGLDNVNSSGTLVDTGTFYLLQFQIDPQAVSFKIDFTARIDDYPFTPFGDFQILGLSPDGVIGREVVWQISAREPTTFGVEFLRDGNTGNHPAGPGWGLNSMLNPDGRLRVVLNGVFGAGVNQPGRVTTYLYDINAIYTIPEPAAMTLLAAPLLVLLMRRAAHRRPAAGRAAAAAGAP